MAILLLTSQETMIVEQCSNQSEVAYLLFIFFILNILFYFSFYFFHFITEFVCVNVHTYILIYCTIEIPIVDEDDESFGDD